VNTSAASVKPSAASRRVRLGLAAALGASLLLCLPDIQHAQQRYKEPAVRVMGVTTSGNVVSISTDGSLNRAQTWQDPDGPFHVVLPNGEAELSGPAHGVRVQHVGNSLELVVPVRRGASVTVEPRGNRLDLVVSGGEGGALNVENFPTDPRAERAQSQSAREQAQQQEQSREEEMRVSQQASKRRGQAEPVAATAPQQSSQQQSPSQQPSQQAAQSAGQPQQGARAANDTVNLAGGGAASQDASKNPAPVPPAAAQLNSREGLSLASYVFSLPALLALLGVALLGLVLFVVRRRRASGEE